MRLGQLARKINISPSDIESLLMDAQLNAESGINTRLTGEQVQLVLQHFAPKLMDTELEEIIESPDEDIQPTGHTPIDSVSAEKDSMSDVKESSSDSVLPELIKAPKIELQGLKVLGKIDLPEPKKKPEPEQKPAEKSEIKTERSSDQPFTAFRKPKPYLNPIEAQRLREAREAEKRKKIEARKKKELKTQAYLKNVVQKREIRKAPTFKTDNTPQVRSRPKPPDSFFGKIWHWLTQAE
jgi:hypothetical protein